VQKRLPWNSVHICFKPRLLHVTPVLTAEATDWVRIAELYEELAQLTGSPVVEVNRAVALGMAYGPEAGLTLVDQLQGLPALQGYHLLPSVRGDLLKKLGRRDEAWAEFARAATMTQNERERALLMDRAGLSVRLLRLRLLEWANDAPCSYFAMHRPRMYAPAARTASDGSPRTVNTTRSSSVTTSESNTSRSIGCCARAQSAPGRHWSFSSLMISSTRIMWNSRAVSTTQGATP